MTSDGHFLYHILPFSLAKSCFQGKSMTDCEGLSSPEFAKTGKKQKPMNNLQDTLEIASKYCKN